jgi:Ubiquinol-cytochrome-c reductase complex subunit (QCR10)
VPNTLQAVSLTLDSAGMGVGFGAATAVALLLFMEEVPPVRRDVFEKIPIIGGYWDRTVLPEDNPY